MFIPQNGANEIIFKIKFGGLKYRFKCLNLLASS